MKFAACTQQFSWCPMNPSWLTQAPMSDSSFERGTHEYSMHSIAGELWYSHCYQAPNHYNPLCNILLVPQPRAGYQFVPFTSLSFEPSTRDVSSIYFPDSTLPSMRKFTNKELQKYFAAVARYGISSIRPADTGRYFLQRTSS